MRQNNLRALRGKYQGGEITVPGDKSISHRAIMFASIANGQSRVSGFLAGEDCLATMRAFTCLGVEITENHDGDLFINGVGKQGLITNNNPLIDLGNSGTSIRLLSGLFSGANLNLTLTGDTSLLKRPMTRVTVPLQEMGANIQTQEDGTAPIKIMAGNGLKGINYTMPIASAQVKSCLLLAGLYANGVTSVIEPAITRDHTERMLKSFGCELAQQGDMVSIDNTESIELQATDIDVPGDISSAAFFMVAAAISQDSTKPLKLNNIGINPTRIGVVNILRMMGADIQIDNKRFLGHEPVADIIITPGNELVGIEIPKDQVSLAIDEFPIIFIAAACAKGRTQLQGAKELRVKESDRLNAMAEGLKTLGIEAETTEDGINILGGQLSHGQIESHDDHRIAMAFAIASLRATGPIEIKDCENIKTSFPNFIELAERIGLNLELVSL